MAGQDHRPGRTTGQHGAAVVRSKQGRADGSLQGPAQVSGLPAREVDQVRLADRLRGRRIVRAVAIAHEDGLGLRAQRGEVAHAHRRPALEHLLAVGV